MHLRRPLLLGAVLLAAGCDEYTSPPLDPRPAPSAAVAAAPGPRYIVGFKDGAVVGVRAAGEATGALAAAHGFQAEKTYGRALAGFSAPLSDAQVAALRADPRVAFVEAVQPVYIEGAGGVQASPIWGLDRIDQGVLPLNGQYTYPTDASDVRVYVLDTGINVAHQEFAGRAVTGYDAFDGSASTTDCHSHGTHVAGTVGGATYGVAKGVTLVPVRVLGCDGSGNSAITVAGIEWVIAQKQASPSTPMVINMSLGGPANTATDEAVKRAVDAGIPVVAAAGNEKVAACTKSPARAPLAVTVAASDAGDRQASFSNYGSCVDLYAPGVGIVSAAHDSNSGTSSKSGTSMAAPHVAGAVALFLDSYPDATPAQAASAITGNAVTGKVLGATTGTPNRLLQVGFIPAAGGVGAARFTRSCLKFACKFDASTSTDPLGILSYGWTWGNGTTGLGKVLTKTYTAPGRYGVTLSVKNRAGMVTTVTDTLVLVDTVPTVHTAVTCVRRKCTFTSTGTRDDFGIKSRRWAFGDSTFYSGASYVKTYKANGSYTATFTVTDSRNQVVVDTVPVTVLDSAPTAAFTVACTGLTCKVDGRTSTDDGGVTGYAWAWGNGSTAAGYTYSKVYATPGTYNITLTVRDAVGQTGTLTKSVTVTR